MALRKHFCKPDYKGDGRSKGRTEKQNAASRRNFTKFRVAGVAANIKNLLRSEHMTNKEKAILTKALREIEGALYLWELEGFWVLRIGKEEQPKPNKTAKITKEYIPF